MYFTGYPNYIQISPGRYTVSIDGNIVYQGNAYLLPDETELNLNVSSIVNQCIECPDYSNVLVTEQNAQVKNTIHTVKIIDSTNKEFNMQYYWNYDYKNTAINELDVLSDYPTPWVYENQIVPWTICANDDKTINIKTKIGSSEFNLLTFRGVIDSQDDIRTFVIKYTPNVINPGLKVDEYLIASNLGKTIDKSALKIRSCQDDNLYTVYYINSKGALSFVHCTCKNVLKNNMTRNQFTQEPDYSKTSLHSSREYLIQRNKTWALNTPFLDDKNSQLLQDLFYSPRVWVFSLKDQKMYAALITDTAVEEKNTLNNRLFNYTINLKESQTYSIKA